jgi:hypothetical protein
MHLVAHRRGGALLGDLLDDYAGREQVCAEPAICLRDAQRPKSRLPQRLQRRLWILGLTVIFGGTRPDLAREIGDASFPLLLCFGQGKVIHLALPIACYSPRLPDAGAQRMRTAAGCM